MYIKLQTRSVALPGTDSLTPSVRVVTVVVVVYCPAASNIAASKGMTTAPLIP
jgi:hypothetical protein